MNIRRIAALTVVIAIFGLIGYVRVDRTLPPAGTGSTGDSTPSAEAERPTAHDPAVGEPADIPRSDGPFPNPDRSEATSDEAVAGREPPPPGLRERQAPDEAIPPGIFGLDPQQDVQAQLDSLMAAEDEDPDWSAATESQIFSEISQVPGLAANLIEVECRTTHCLIRVTLPSQTPATETGLMTTGADGHPVFPIAEALDLEPIALLSLRNPNGHSLFVAYLNRNANSATQSAPTVHASA